MIAMDLNWLSDTLGCAYQGEKGVRYEELP